MDNSAQKNREILKLVSASPKAVEGKDRDLWLSLFADEAWLEDPAGSRRFFTNGSEWSLAAFYDIFINNVDLSIDVFDDYLSENEIVRESRIAIGIPAGGTITVPAYLRYEVSDEARISGLRAYWSPLQAIVSFLKPGSGGTTYLFGLARRLVGAFGLRGISGFMGGTPLLCPASRITILRLKNLLEEGRFFQATMLFGDLDYKEIRLCYESGAVSLPANYLVTGELRIHEISSIVCAGSYVGFKVSARVQGAERQGIALVTMGFAGLRMKKLELFLHE